MDDAPREPAAPADGDGTSFLRLIEELHASPLAREPGDRPVDLAENYKHYLYGHPKVEDR